MAVLRWGGEHGASVSGDSLVETLRRKLLVRGPLSAKDTFGGELGGSRNDAVSISLYISVCVCVRTRKMVSVCVCEQGRW